MKRKKEPLTELHKIREQLYKEGKHLSPEERAAKTRKEAEEICREYNLHLPRLEKTKK